jgi:hypothetical protein
MGLETDEKPNMKNMYFCCYFLMLPDDNASTRNLSKMGER